MAHDTEGHNSPTIPPHVEVSASDEAMLEALTGAYLRHLMADGEIEAEMFVALLCAKASDAALREWALIQAERSRPPAF